MKNSNGQSSMNAVVIGLVVAIIAVGAFALGTSGALEDAVSSDGPAEQLGEKIDNAADELSKKIDEAAEPSKQ